MSLCVTVCHVTTCRLHVIQVFTSLRAASGSTAEHYSQISEGRDTQQYCNLYSRSTPDSLPSLV